MRRGGIPVKQAPWQRTMGEIKRLYQEICQNDGCTISWLSRRMGLSYQQIINRLVGAERMGLLVMEDEAGRLYRFSMDS